MSVTINLYNCTDDPKTVTKNNKTLLLTTGAELYNEVNLETPTFRLSWYSFSLICQANYLYVAEYDKYYFIKDRQTDSGGAMIITCEEDYLSTFGPQIRSLPGIMVRNSRKNEPGSYRSTWIPDPLLPMNTGRAIRCIQFEGSALNIDTAGFASNNFVLNVAGHGVMTPTPSS